MNNQVETEGVQDALVKTSEVDLKLQARIKRERVEQARKRREVEDRRRAPVGGGSITSQRLDISLIQKVALTAAQEAISKSTIPIKLINHQTHQDWLKSQKIVSFISRFSNKTDLAFDLADILEENRLANPDLIKALSSCSLTASEVLEYLEK